MPRRLCEGCSKENKKSLEYVNENFYDEKMREGAIFLLFKKTNEGYYENNEYKITIKDDKITDVELKTGYLELALNLNSQKYVLFAIKLFKNKVPIYLYCSDIESITSNPSAMTSAFFRNKYFCNSLRYYEC